MNTVNQNEEILYVLAPIIGTSHYVIKDDVAVVDQPYIVFDTCDQKEYSPMEQKGIRVEFGREIRTSIDGTEQTGKFITLTCTNENYLDLFKGLMAPLPLLSSMANNPNSDTVKAELKKVVDMFKSRPKPQRTDTLGLVGELWFIYQHEDSAKALEKWHDDPNAKFDFEFENNHNIEVKTSSNIDRSLHVTLAQASGSIIYSVCIIEKTDGMTLEMLRDEIEKKVNYCPELVKKLNDVIALTLGGVEHMAEEMQFSFNEVEAARTGKKFKVVVEEID